MVSQNSKNIIDAALRLSEVERIELAERLWLSVDAQVRGTLESPWDKEIDQRIADARRDPSKLVNGDQVLQKLEAGQRP